ncbi:MAG: hypothetical protein V3W41_08200 [Planctomycetota bacterium]
MVERRVECIHVKNLVAFADEASRGGDKWSVVPISRTRARAWACNPDAVPDDIVLIVGFVDERCAGYLGLLPGRVLVNGQTERVFWLSTFYVGPDSRKTGLAGMLLMRAIGLRLTLAACESSEEAQAVYRALRFQELGPLPYSVIDFTKWNVLGIPLRMVRKALRKPGKRNSWLDFPIDVFCRVTKLVSFPFLLKQLGNDARREWSEVSSLPDWPDHQSSRSEKCVFVRDSNTIRWMLEHHWVTTERAKDTPGYYFSDFRDTFEYRIFRSETSNSHSECVLLWLTTRDRLRDIHILDCDLSSPGSAAAVARLALEVARNERADRVYLPAEFAEPLLNSRLFRRTLRMITRPYFIRVSSKDSRVSASLEEVELHYCDGDVPFA